MEFPQRLPRSSPERAGLSAPADEVPPHAAARAEPDKAASRESLVIAKADAVSKVREEELTVDGDASAAGFRGGNQEEVLALQCTGAVQEGDADAAVAEAAATLADECLIERSVPVHDVKTENKKDEIVREEELAVFGDSSASGFKGGNQEEGALAFQSTGGVQEEDGEAAVAEASAMLVDESVIKRFVPVKDVKTMLQSGLLEGKRIIYRNKKNKIDLLHGMIKGTSYFCLCGNCDKTDKELSAKAFEQHAKADSHNANDHIYLQVSKLSLFEISKKLKEATDASMLEEVFKDLVKDHDSDGFRQNNTSVAADPKLKIIERLELLEKRMEVIEQIQSQVNTLEKNVEFLVNETVRCHGLFKELSEVLKKLGDI